MNILSSHPFQKTSCHTFGSLQASFQVLEEGSEVKGEDNMSKDVHRPRCMKWYVQNPLWLKKRASKKRCDSLITRLL